MSKTIFADMKAGSTVAHRDQFVGVFEPSSAKAPALVSHPVEPTLSNPAADVAPERAALVPPPTDFFRSLLSQTSVAVPLQRRASVDRDLGAGDVTALVGKQEQHKGRDLLGRPHAFHWD